jgi:hypothetical protein
MHFPRFHGFLPLFFQRCTNTWSRKGGVKKSCPPFPTSRVCAKESGCIVGFFDPRIAEGFVYCTVARQGGPPDGSGPAVFHADENARVVPSGLDQERSCGAPVYENSDSGEPSHPPRHGVPDLPGFCHFFEGEQFFPEEGVSQNTLG